MYCAAIIIGMVIDEIDNSLLPDIFFNDSTIDTVYRKGEIALATTAQIKQVDGRQWQLAFTLTKQEKGWIVKDIDWLPPGKETQEIEKFRKAFSNAKEIQKKETNITVQVEGEEG